jgi:hypothetical protein
MKYEIITKRCPICEDEFQTKRGHPREKTVCSHSCSNVFFAARRNKPERYKNYRTICFKHWPKKCVICNEDKIVEVHHYDENTKNNNYKNLIPLCPTHHQYWHSRYRNLIREKVDLFIENGV